MSHGIPATKFYAPKLPHVPYTFKDIVWLGVVHPPLSLVFAWSLRHEPPQQVNNVDAVEEVDNELFPFVSGVSEIDIQIPQNKWGATRWAGFPCHPKIVHPQRVSGGMYTPMQ
jgi:hypothetical protein